MNLQSIMQQAKKMQNDMLKEKEKIDNKIYTGTASFVTAEVMGNKKIKTIKYDLENIDSEDKEILEDLVVVAINNAMEQIDKDIEAKLGKYTQGMPGIF